MTAWWETYFDEDYVRLWQLMRAGGHSERQADSLWALLALSKDARVLDAPCGYGRVAHALAAKGARVLGIDHSEAALREAERGRGDLASDRLSYRRHDLRLPLDVSGFDAAVCLYTSLGYGSEEDDLAILTGLRSAVRSGGRVFVEVAHRDSVASRIGSGRTSRRRLSDGTRLITESRFDARTGRLESVRRWMGSAGSGMKVSSIRVYTVAELSDLARSAGLAVRSTYRGCSPQPFGALGGTSHRVGLLTVSP